MQMLQPTYPIIETYQNMWSLINDPNVGSAMTYSFSVYYEM